MITQLRRAIVALAAVRLLGMVAGFLSLPAYLRFFEESSALGVWFVLLTFLSWLLTFDFGIGNGLRNRVAIAAADGDSRALQSVISATYALGLGIGLAIGFAATTLVILLDWNRLLNIDADVLGSTALRHALFVIVLATMSQLVLRNVIFLLYALQKAVSASVLPVVTSIGMLVFALTAPTSDVEQNLVTLAYAYLLLSTAPLASATLLLFGGRLRGCAPRLRHVTRSGLRAVSSLGLWFFIINIAYMSIMTTDTALVAALATPEEVVAYQMYSRPFGLVSSLFVMALAPLWSAFTRAWALGEEEWVRRSYRRMLAAVAGGVAFSLLIAACLQLIIDVWLGTASITVQSVETWTFVVLTAVAMWSAAMSSVASGLGEVRLQFTSYGLAALAKLPLAWWLTEVTGSWIGVVWSTIAGLLMYSIVMSVWARHTLTKGKLVAPVQDAAVEGV